MLTPTPAEVVLWLHILAATIWIGGQATLAALIPLVRGDRLLLQRLARRFAGLAWVAFAALIVTGVLNMHFAGIGLDMTATARGRTLAIKLVLVLASGLAAAFHQSLSARNRESAVLAAVGGGLSLAAAMAAALFGVIIAQT
ncbi:MAG TPA: CopD family protein [Chloroflexota bacterium]|nr:CopD family protein [Chloroflexota bacterium]